MKEARISMGMPAMVEIVGEHAQEGIDAVFSYFIAIEEQFSPYRAESEVSRVNSGGVPLAAVSAAYAEVLALAEKTKKETYGYFDVHRPTGGIDPSGIVKGWALKNAAQLLHSLGYTNFCIDVGADVAVSGCNASGALWSIGIRNPFNHDEIVKVVRMMSGGVATSGSAARGDHIYNPHDPTHPVRDVASITVVGRDILEADRFATAAFAMGKEGINFIETIPGLEAYSIDTEGVATMTSGFHTLTHP